MSAADLARRLAITAKSDLNSVKDIASQGAKKVCVFFLVHKRSISTNLLSFRLALSFRI
jgi:hypothetical protein